ncbi:MAG: NADH-quinone oxidoreductase subunit L [Candidatus Eisenbacteria bacterium]|uniref:NADH-quinone oxidoreductase subunit L n=1 Tax=Eiseniibacteriota bacterium TaxID=2212470 RepID=A0A849SG64_UNCEI|nr:NADH-quinone oxidoreductase subunit L [Candidatus Eisenbacteria bacterium]
MSLPLLWIIPALPLAAVLLSLLIGDRLGKRGTTLLACGAVGAAFAFAVRAVLQLAALPPAERVLNELAYTWMRVGDFHVDVAFMLDPLSSVMVLVVTGVGFLIHVYATGYMAHDHSFRRFFMYLNLFMFAMLTLVLADNFLLMFVGWEGVGLCSYLLIGFWYDRPAAAQAGKKAFIVNRIGDFGVILGMLFVFTHTGSLQYEQVFKAAPLVFALGSTIITTATLLLFLGATGKSAQLPLYTWLPDAMEGPTPVSALIHAATMVTAGVYLVARSHVLFELAPATLEVVAVIGAATALFAATIGLVQNDIKRVLAYSTVSQLGYMFFACGVGAFGAGIFHVMTHAFFKALLFMGAGSVIHALHNEQDLRKMGGLASKLPWTHGVMLVATIAIAGIPPFAGFFSKDEILHHAFASGHYGVWLAGLVGAALTAFYMFRLYILTFRGKSRLSHEAEHHLHESPPSMIAPLVVLAALSVVGGWIGLPMQQGGHALERWLAPSLETHASAAHDMAGMTHGAAGASHDMAGMAHSAAGATHHEVSRGTEWLLIVLSVGVALFGIALAFRMYLQSPGLGTTVRQRLGGIHRMLLEKYWVDELYDATVVRPTMAISNLFWKLVDSKLVDGLVNGVAFTVESTSAVLRLFQTGFVGTYALFTALGVAALILHFLRG